MCEKSYKSLCFLQNKSTVVLVLNKKKKKKSMAGRLALISNLIIAKQYMSVKEEKGIRFKNKNKNHF